MVYDVLSYYLFPFLFSYCYTHVTIRGSGKTKLRPGQILNLTPFIRNSIYQFSSYVILGNRPRHVGLHMNICNICMEHKSVLKYLSCFALTTKENFFAKRKHAFRSKINSKIQTFLRKYPKQYFGYQ